MFDPTLRVLLCTNCDRPIQASSTDASGAPVESHATCAACGTTNTLAARDDSGDLRAAQQPPRVSEAQRIQVLRAQDGTRLEPPPALVHLLSGHDVTAEPGGFVWRTWTDARNEAAQQSSYAAAERLYFLTAILQRELFANSRERELRALLETALDHISEPRFRAALHGMMARSAARAGAFPHAAFWLSLCSPHSDDIETDTSYRLAAAYVAAAQRQYARVLELLGTHINDVPIADTSDVVCGVLRADALEKTGQLERAAEQLGKWCATSEDDVRQIIARNDSLRLCPESMAKVVAQTQQLEADVVRTRNELDDMPQGKIVSGTSLTIVGMVVVLLAGIWLIEHVSLVLGMAVIVLVIIVGPVVLIAAAAALSTPRKPPASASDPVMVRATATLLSLSSTQRILRSRGPVMDLRLRVESPQHPTFIAMHKHVVPRHKMGEMTPGTLLPVTFERDDRRTLEIATS